MPQRKRYYRNEYEENGDRFETEAFSHMNDDEPEDSKAEHNQELDIEDSDPEDVQEKPETDSDDEAPEDIGFHDSRQSVLSQLRSAMRQVDAEKQKKKSKRKMLDAQFKEQKAKKREYLESAKLPEDFLETIADKIPKKVSKTGIQKKVQKIEIQKKVSKTESMKRSLGKRNENGKKRRHKKKDMKGGVSGKGKSISKDRQGQDFIAFTDSASGVQVTDLKYLEKQSKSVAQLAADFKQKRLYGPDIKRESNQARLAKKEKRRFRAR